MILGNLMSGKSTLQKEFHLLGLFLRRLPRQQVIQLCPVATAASPPKEEGKVENIPCLPVQPLEQMIDTYLKSIKPFVNSSQFEHTKQIVKSFCEDENSGKKLQYLLEKRAKTTENWLADWWLQAAYLEYRNPVIVYSSPGLVWPQVTFKNIKEQLCFTASLISAALEFNKLVEENKIPQEKLGGKYLCMSQYKKIFGTCRIPKIPRDELLFQDAHNPSRNIIVMFNNHMFSLPVFEENSREPLNTADFYAMLLDIYEKENDTPGLPVGVLTTGHRDNWAKSYEVLKSNANNKHILEEYIEKALFVVCVDKPLSLGAGLDYNTRCSRLLLHGFGFRGNAGNRWYDKTVQFVVGADEDGVGIAYEHSPAEGGPIGVLTDFVIDRIYNKKSIEPSAVYLEPKKLDFVTSEAIKKDIIAAGAAVDKINDELDVLGWSFRDFGKETIKGFKLSPDSFVQIAIQLAFYKLHNHPAAQYESGSLRKYIYGRTDTIRTCSEEVVKFCQVMTDPKSTKEEKETSLRAAIASHKKYAQAVIEGRGVDRHLLGLKILAKINNFENPKIFSDVAYERSTYFQLSTSNVPTRADGFMVYGPLVDDGYACCYNPRDMGINFGMSAWSTCRETRLNGFRQALEESLLDMKDCLTVLSKL